MSLDYRLSPDSPLLRDGVFERLTYRPDGPQDGDIRSLMQLDEYLSLLSFPGVVWFVSKHTRQGTKQAAVAILSGMPWPLWDGEERQRLLLSVSVVQGQLLKKLFRPRKSDLPVVLEWDEPMSPLSKTVEKLAKNGIGIWRDFWLRKSRSDRSLKELARKTGQDVNLVRQTVHGLRRYIECLDSYWCQQSISQQAG